MTITCETVEKKKRKQDLGIFYTRPDIVDFIYDILLVWKEKEDMDTARWASHKPKHYPSVIDPACGEGIFLKKAIEKKFTIPKYVWGIDVDIHAKDRWQEINLLKSFGSEADLDIHFIHQNGLLPLNGDKILRYKKGGLREFDAVVGNPPYGGIGVDLSSHPSAESIKLLESLRAFHVFTYKNKKRSNGDNYANGLFDALVAEPIIAYSSVSSKEAESILIEVLFIERFIQLCKDGGWIAIIIPDGILANSNMHYVREFIAESTKVEAIVSLPRDAFKHVGTTAKTSILFLKKQRMVNQEYPVFLASLNKMEDYGLKQIVEQYKEFYYEGKLK
jgi:type I restriction-modification system DNA methylase subunit